MQVFTTKEILKSVFCIKGNNELYKYAKTKRINHKKIGKLIVAQNEEEINLLKDYIKKQSLTMLNYIF